MDGAVCPVTAAVAIAGIGAAAWCGRRQKHAPTAARFAAVTALTFAAQMVNYPVQYGTSGHLIGGVLAAGLLGVPFGVLSLALVILIQTFLFADGGVAQLGANILNMSLITAGIAGWFAHDAMRRLTGWKRHATVAAAAWGSVMLAAAACSIELAIAGAAPLGSVLPAMLGTHALIGVGEALVTVALLAVIPAPFARDEVDVRGVLVTFGLALFAAVILSQFASTTPDGLEWVAQQLGFAPGAAATLTAPFAGYQVSWLSLHDSSSTGLAGLAGVIAVALTAVGVRKAL